MEVTGDSGKSRATRVSPPSMPSPWLASSVRWTWIGSISSVRRFG